MKAPSTRGTGEVAGRNMKLEKSEQKWFRAFYSRPGAKIQFQTNNPKREGTLTHARYEKYKGARTVEEFKKLGGTLGDLTFVFCRGHVLLEGTSAIRLIRSAPAVLRKLLYPSTTATTARILAEESNIE